MQRAACCRRCARARRHHSTDRSGQRARTRSLAACKLSCAYTSSTPTLPVSAPRCRWVRTSLSITRAPHTSGAAPRTAATHYLHAVTGRARLQPIVAARHAANAQQKARSTRQKVSTMAPRSSSAAMSTDMSSSTKRRRLAAQSCR